MDFTIDGSGKIYPDAAAAIEALRKARKWKSIFTSATFKVSETDDEITDAICAYPTQAELDAHRIDRTPAMIVVDEKINKKTGQRTSQLRETAPATMTVTEAPRIVWTSPRIR